MKTKLFFALALAFLAANLLLNLIGKEMANGPIGGALYIGFIVAGMVGLVTYRFGRRK